MIIDAHQHVWDLASAEYPWLGPEQGSINRTIGFDELAPQLVAAGVDHTVLVQSADNDADTDHMLMTAALHQQVSGVVGYVPLDRPDEAARRLDELAVNPLVVGVRNLIHDQPDPDWLARPEVTEGLGLLAERGLPFDVVAVLPRHLEHVIGIGDRYPELRMVIDHLAKPPIKGPSPRPWRDLIRAAAENPNVYAKISGLYPSVGPLDDWQAADLRPFVDTALAAFGPQRLMYGGDWPVSIPAGGYQRVFDGLAAALAELGDADRRAVYADSARRFYRLDPDRLR